MPFDVILSTQWVNLMFKQLDIQPAYGRDYKSIAEVKTDWESGKDFQIIPSGAYVSIRESNLLLNDNITELNVRYSKLRKKLIIALEI